MHSCFYCNQERRNWRNHGNWKLARLVKHNFCLHVCLQLATLGIRWINRFRGGLAYLTCHRMKNWSFSRSSSMFLRACEHTTFAFFWSFLQVGFFAPCANMWSLARSLWPWRPLYDLTPLDTWCWLRGFRLAIGTCLGVIQIRRKRLRLKPELFKRNIPKMIKEYSRLTCLLC